MLEEGDVLQFVVFQDLEILLGESFNDIPILVERTDMNLDKVYVNSYPERTVSRGSLPRSGRSLREQRYGQSAS